VVLVVVVVPVLITVFLLAMELVERVLVHRAPPPDTGPRTETAEAGGAALRLLDAAAEIRVAAATPAG
jgi:hypothetical protein